MSNRHRKRMKIADSVALSQLRLVLEMMDGNHTSCCCSIKNYLCENCIEETLEYQVTQVSQKL